MRIFMPTKFTMELAEELAEYSGRITFYGQSARDFLGGGRPSLFLPDPSRDELKEYISRVKSMGYRFSYLVNTSCTGGVETTKEGNRKLRELFEWVGESGADEVTLAIPFLAEMCKKIVPNIKINCGLYARITDVTTAVKWKELGAEKLTLFLNLNRDFKLLKRIKEVTGCEIELVATLSCIFGCIHSPFCSSLISHSSMKREGGSVVYTVHNCYGEKLKDRVELIKSRWIRPEDLPYYREVGVDVIKITERYDDTETLVKKARAYLEESYDGNFFELLSLHPKKPVKFGNDGIKRYLFKRGLLEQKRVNDYLKFTADIFLDNRVLDGFIDFFREGRCDPSDCERCGYCHGYASKIRIENGEEVINERAKFMNDMVDGNFFKK